MLCFLSGLNAQRKYYSNTSTWFTYIGTHHIGGKWSLFADVQWRRSDFVSQQMQLLLRPGLLYHINESVNIGGGYLYLMTEVYGSLPAKSPFSENRTWQQFQYKTSISKIEVSNRIRLEQRWIHFPVERADGSWTAGDAIYTNRVRIMYKFLIPFKGSKIEDRSLYLYTADEVYINFGKNVKSNVFEQNRAQLGLGYRIPNIGRFETGYINQILVRPNGNDIELNHIFQMALLANFDLKKRETKH